MKSKVEDRVIRLLRKKGVIRPIDLKPYGIPRVYLTRLCQRGVVERVGRGLYRLAGAEASEHITLAAAAKLVPNGVVCLLSALSFHGLTTQIPHEVWMAIGVKARRPKVAGVPLRIVRFSEKTLTTGVETHRIDGVSVKITCPAKTVADCFKYRNKIGLEVALEALRECRRQRKCSIEDLWRYAKICRVTNVMKPYLEAIG